MTKLIRLLPKSLELACALAGSLFLWFACAGVIHWVIFSNTATLVVVVLAYAVYAFISHTLADRAVMLIDASVKPFAVQFGFWLFALCLPFVSLSVAGLITPLIQVHNYAGLLLLVVIGYVTQCVLVAVTGGLHTKLESLKATTHTAKIVSCFRPDGMLGVWNAEFVSGTLTQTSSLFVLPEDNLLQSGELLNKALDQVMANDLRHTPAADEICARAIPQLRYCGLLGVLRLELGFAMLRQSWERLGHVKDAQLCALRETSCRALWHKFG